MILASFWIGCYPIDCMTFFIASRGFLADSTAVALALLALVFAGIARADEPKEIQDLVARHSQQTEELDSSSTLLRNQELKKYEEQMQAYVARKAPYPAALRKRLDELAASHEEQLKALRVTQEKELQQARAKLPRSPVVPVVESTSSSENSVSQSSESPAISGPRPTRVIDFPGKKK